MKRRLSDERIKSGRARTGLSPVRGVDFHVVVAQISGPINPGAIAQAQIHLHGNILRFHSRCQIILVIGKCAALGHHLHAAEFERGFFKNQFRAGIAGGGQHTAPIGISAEEGGLDQGRVRDGLAYGFGIGLGTCPRRFDGYQLGGPSPSRMMSLAKSSIRPRNPSSKVLRAITERA